MSEPTTRIGDAERDEAVRLLQEHHAAGRLDLAEFDERVDSALRARTRADLDHLFGDLPASGNTPAATLPALRPAAPVEKPHGTWTWQRAVSSAAFPLAVVLCMATDWRWWWIIMIPMVVNAFVWGGDGRKGHDDAGDH